MQFGGVLAGMEVSRLGSGLCGAWSGRGELGGGGENRSGNGGGTGGLRAFCKQYRQFEPCLVRLRESRPVPGVRELSVAEVLSLHRR